MGPPTESRLSRETGITAVDDAALITAYLELEDAASFSELIRRHQIGVYRLLSALLANPDRAESACEEVFVRAAHRLGEVDRNADIAGWLAELSREVATDLENADDPLPDVAGFDATLAEDAGRGAVKGAVRRALANLEPEERSVLLLVELHGEPLDRAASTLGMPPSQVRSRLETARKKFAAAFRRPTEADVRTSDVAGGDTIVDLTSTHECDGYEVLGILGEGGMGRVYRARHIETNTERALKVLLPELIHSANVLARFDREAAIARQLEHPHLAAVFEQGKTREGAPYLAMELLVGKNLADQIADAGKLALPDAMHVMRQLLDALGYLHGLDIVHRDVKPENVMLVERDGDPAFVKLLDLGIAKVPPSLAESPGAERLTSAGLTLGTPAYIAPEQALGSAIDGRADLYAASVTLFEMLTGKLPFQADDAGAMLAKHISMPPPRLRHRGIEASRELEILVARGMSKQPYDRYDSAEEFVSALSEVA